MPKRIVDGLESVEVDEQDSDRVDATYAEHAKILRAIMQRKADPARLMIRSHIEQSKTEVHKITLHTLHEARATALAGRLPPERWIPARCQHAPAGRPWQRP